MGGRTHFLGEGEAQLEAFKPVCIDQANVELEHVRQKVFGDVPAEQYPHFLSRVGAVVDLDHLDQASKLQLWLTAESLEVDLQPFADTVDLLELREEGQPQLRLLDDPDEELEHCLVVVNVFFAVEGVYKVVEEPNEAEKSLSGHSDITVLSHAHKDGDQHPEQNGVTAAPPNHLQQFQPQQLAGSILAAPHTGEDHLQNNLESLVIPFSF